MNFLFAQYMPINFREREMNPDSSFSLAIVVFCNLPLILLGEGSGREGEGKGFAGPMSNFFLCACSIDVVVFLVASDGQKLTKT